MSTSITGQGIGKSLSGKRISSSVRSAFKSSTGATNSNVIKAQIAKSLAGKSSGQRSAVYKKLGISATGRKSLESKLVGKRGPTLMEKNVMKKEAARKKRRNIFMSRRSAENDGSGSQAGFASSSTVGYAGGDVEVKSMFAGLTAAKSSSKFAGGKSGKSGFGSGSSSSKSGFANGSSGMSGGGGMSKPGGGMSKPLGF